MVAMSGVSYGSIKRFESTGQISLLSLIKIATALGMAEKLRQLFMQVPYRNIEEVINEAKDFRTGSSRNRRKSILE